MTSNFTNVDVRMDRLAEKLHSTATLIGRRIEFVPAQRPQNAAPTKMRRDSTSTSKSSSDRSQNGSGSTPQTLSNGFREPRKEIFHQELLPRLWKWDTRSPVGAGFRNLGNTCFLNSVLQCLTYTPALANYLRARAHSKKCRVSGFCAMCQLESFVTKALSANRKVLQPDGIVRNLRLIGRQFKHGRQHDAHEFLRYLLDAMQKSALQRYSKISDDRIKETTIVHRIFGGYSQSQVKCKCGYESNTFEPFLDLSVEITEANSVEKALAQFCAPEKLTGDNKYMCARCKRKMPSTKQMTIFRAPNVLTIQLKRFGVVGVTNGGMHNNKKQNHFNSRPPQHLSKSARKRWRKQQYLKRNGGGGGMMDALMMMGGGFGGGGQKLSKRVAFPERLDLSRFMSQRPKTPTEYELYGMVVHMGSSLHSGHYISLVKAPNGQWNEISDSMVRKASSKSALNQEAFILFYRRTTLPIPRKSSSNGAPSPTSQAPATATVGQSVSSQSCKDETSSVSSKENLKRKTPSEGVLGETPSVDSADSLSVVRVPPTKKQKKGTLRDLASIFAKIRHPGQAPAPAPAALTEAAHSASSQHGSRGSLDSASDGEEETVVQRNKPPPIQILSAAKDLGGVPISDEGSSASSSSPSASSASSSASSSPRSSDDESPIGGGCRFFRLPFSRKKSAATSAPPHGVAGATADSTTAITGSRTSDVGTTASSGISASSVSAVVPTFKPAKAKRRLSRVGRRSVPGVGVGCGIRALRFLGPFACNGLGAGEQARSASNGSSSEGRNGRGRMDECTHSSPSPSAPVLAPVKGALEGGAVDEARSTSSKKRVRDQSMSSACVTACDRANGALAPEHVSQAFGGSSPPSVRRLSKSERKKRKKQKLLAEAEKQASEQRSHASSVKAASSRESSGIVNTQKSEKHSLSDPGNKVPSTTTESSSHRVVPSKSTSSARSSGGAVLGFSVPDFDSPRRSAAASKRSGGGGGSSGSGVVHLPWDPNALKNPFGSFGVSSWGSPDAAASTKPKKSSVYDAWVQQRRDAIDPYEQELDLGHKRKVKAKRQVEEVSAEASEHLASFQKQRRAGNVFQAQQNVANKRKKLRKL